MIWMTDLSGFAASQLILHEINNRRIAIFFNTRRQWKSPLSWSRNSWSGFWNWNVGRCMGGPGPVLRFDPPHGLTLPTPHEPQGRARHSVRAAAPESCPGAHGVTRPPNRAPHAASPISAGDNARLFGYYPR